MVFTAIHLAAVLAADELRIGPRELLIPFARPDNPVAQGSGALAFYLLTAVVLTSWAQALPSGRRRQYSLCGDPDDACSYRIAILQVAEGRGGSVEVHTGARAGQLLTVEGQPSCRQSATPFPPSRPGVNRASVARAAPPSSPVSPTTATSCSAARGRAAGAMLICVSRARSERLTLDL